MTVTRSRRSFEVAAPMRIAWIPRRPCRRAFVAATVSAVIAAPSFGASPTTAQVEALRDAKLTRTNLGRLGVVNSCLDPTKYLLGNQVMMGDRRLRSQAGIERGARPRNGLDMGWPFQPCD